MSPRLPRPDDMDSVRNALASARACAKEVTAEEKITFVRQVLDAVCYESLSREDKGVVREYLQRVTGYSRAQVTRMITSHRQSSSRAMAVVEKFHGVFRTRRNTVFLVATCLLLIVTLRRGASPRASLLQLNEGNVPPSSVVTNIDVGGSQNTQLSRVLLVRGEEPEARSLSSAAETVRMLLERVAERRELRERRIIRTTENRLTRTAIVRTETVASSNSLIDALGKGRNGQVLTFVNGRPQWRSIERLHSAGRDSGIGRKPASERESSGGGGERRFGGGGGSVTVSVGSHDHQNDAGGGILDINAATTGILRVAKGGTGFGSYATGDLLVGDAGGGLSKLARGTNGQVLTASGGTVLWEDAATGSTLDLTATDARYVKKQGDTMTGALIISVTSGNINTLGLRIVNALSGAVVHAEKTLTSSGTLVWEGAASGASLYVASSLNGVGLTDCDAANQTLNWDATTGRFSCGADESSGSGLGINEGDARYVKKQGDTMSGALAIYVGATQAITADSGLALEVIGTASGRILRAQNTLASSGTLVWEGAASGASLYVASSLNGAGLTDCDAATQTLAWDATTGRFSCGTDADTTYTAGQGLSLNGTAFSLSSSISGTLLEFTTVSGATVYGTNSVRSSGSLVWEGAASGATLYVASSLQGAGLADCDASTSALQWDATTGRFSCDTTAGNTYTAGQGLTLTNSSFSLTAAHSGTTIEAITLLSGATVHAQNLLRSSGTLLVESGAHIDGDTFYVNAENNTVSLTNGSDSIVLNPSTGGTPMIQLNNGGEVNAEITANNANGVMFNTKINVSGRIVWDGGSAEDSGTLSKIDISGDTGDDVGIGWSENAVANKGFIGFAASSSDLVYRSLSYDFSSGTERLRIMSTGNVGIDRVTSPGSRLSVSGAVIVNPNGNLGSAAADTGIALEVIGTASGRVVRANDRLISSGSLVVEGAMTGTHLYVATTFDGAGLADCDTAGTSKLLWDASTKRFSCGADQNTAWSNTGSLQTAFDARYVNTSGDTMTGALTIRVTGGGLMTLGLEIENLFSGAVIRAQNTLASSGTLVWEGAASGSSLYVASSLQGVGLTDCDAATQTLAWNATTGRFSCGTDADSGAWSNTGSLQTAFDARYVNTSGDTMTGLLLIDVAQGVTGLSVSGAVVFNDNGQDNDVRMEGDTDSGLFFLDASTDRIGIGTTAPDTKLEVIGTLSGIILHAQTQLRSSGVLLVEDDAVIQGGNINFTQNTTIGDNGDQITIDSNGTLVISDETIDLSVQAVAVTLKSLQNALNFDANTLTIDASANRVGILTTAPDTALEVIGTISGAVVYAKDSLRSSGSLVWEGAASGATLYVASGFEGSGLTDCDATTQKLLWDDTTNRFSCGADLNTAWSNTGSLQTAFDARYVNTSGDTMTGALTIRVTGGGLMTLGLEVESLLSGAVIRAQNTLASSGTLVWEGAASGATLYVASGFEGSGLTDCDVATQTLAWDSTTKRFSCGTDSDTTYTAGQGLTLTATAFSLSSTISGSLLEFTTVSGSTVYGTNSVRSSGSLVWEGAASGATVYIGGTLEGAGLSDCDADGQTLSWDATNKRFGCGDDDNSGGTPEVGTSSFSGGVLRLGDPRYVNVGGDAMTGGLIITSGNPAATIDSGLLLEIVGTASGRIFHAHDVLRSSGTLITESGAIFDGGTLYVDAPGNRVGIGTTSPTFDLDVTKASASAGGVSILTRNTTANGFSSFRLMNDTTKHAYMALGGSTHASLAREMLLVNEDSGPMRFYTKNTLRMTISSGGLVGIGTTSPDSALEIIGTASGRIVRAQDTLASSGSIVLKKLAGTATGNILIVDTAGLVYDATNKRVGIGDASPISKLYLVDGQSAFVFSGSSVTSGYTGKFTLDNTGLKIGHNSASRDIELQTNSTTRMTVLAGGNVGIATTSPDSALHVMGEVRIDNNTDTTNKGCFRYNGTSNQVEYSNDCTTFQTFSASAGGWTDDGAIVRLTTITDKVGIGTGGSLANLTVFEGDESTTFTNFTQAVTDAGILIETQYTAGAYTPGLFWETSNNNTGKPKAGIWVHEDADGTDLILGTSNAYSTGITNSGIVLNPSGFVGIGGVGAPQTTLHLRSDSTDTAFTNIASYALSLSNSNSTSNNYTGINFSDGVGQAGTAGIGVQFKDHTNNKGDMGFFTRDSVSYAERVRLTHTGSLGIGTTTPGSKLSVSGAVIIGTAISSSAADTGLALEVIGTASGRILHAQDSLRSSGSLLVEGVSVLQGNVTLGDSSEDTITLNGEIGSDVLPKTSSFYDLGSSSKFWEQIYVGDIRFGNASDSSRIQFNDDGVAANDFIGLDADGNLTSELVVLASGKVGIGTTEPDTTLEVIGTISGAVVTTNTLRSSGSLVWEGAASGATVYIGGTLEGAGLSDCDADGQTLSWDATNKRFGCGDDDNSGGTPEVGTSSFSGGVLRLGDPRYVNVGGDAMTGGLIITSGNPAATIDSGLLLEIVGTASGRIFHAHDVLRSSGTLITESGAYIDGNTFYVAAGSNRVGIGTATPDTALDVIGTISGAVVTANTLRSSGTLVWEGAASGAALYIGGTFEGAGLTDCDADGQALSWDSTNKRFVCGDDDGGGGGLSMSDGDARYVNQSGDTMTGALTINVTGGNINTVGLKVINTASGAHIHAEKTLTSSGNLTVEGTMSGATFAGAGLTDCDSGGNYLQWDTTGKKFSCNTTGTALVEKDADESVSSSTTLQNDDALKFAMAANTAYLVDMKIRVVNGCSPCFGGGIRVNVTVPSNTSRRLTVAYTSATGSAFSFTSPLDDAATEVDVGGSSFQGWIHIYGLVQSSSTTADFQFQWAQSSAGGTTTVQKNSTLQYTKLAGAADLAEVYFSNDPTIHPGDVVSIDPSLHAGVQRSRGANDPHAIGIVSTKPALIIGEAGEGWPIYVALAGRVPVKVSSENGPIETGDLLTTSSTPGVAMKATRAGAIIGQALTPWKLDGEGTVLAFVRNDSMPIETQQAIAQLTTGSGSVAHALTEEDVLRTLSGALASLSIEDRVRTTVDAHLTASGLDPVTLGNRLSAIEARLSNLTGSTIPTTASATLLPLPDALSLSGSIATEGMLSALHGSFEDTIAVGGDTRIGGDLYLEGAMHVTNLFVPGSMAVDGTLRVTDLEVAGSLHFASGASLSSLIVEDAFHVIGDVTIEGMAHFLGDVRVQGELIVSGKQAGYALIPKSGTSVTVLFQTGFVATPVVTASPDHPVLYAVSKATQTGFAISLASVAPADVTFSWLALATENPVTATGTASTLADALIDFPVDGKGIPVTSSAPFNACIRNRTLLDPSGNPYSCDRYHEDATWYHPDLTVAFTWNTAFTPPLLTIPEGYELVVVPYEEAGSSSSSENSSEGAGSSESSTTSTASDGSESAASVSSEDVSTESSAGSEGSASSAASDGSASSVSIDSSLASDASSPSSLASPSSESSDAMSSGHSSSSSVTFSSSSDSSAEASESSVSSLAE